MQLWESQLTDFVEFIEQCWGKMEDDILSQDLSSDWIYCHEKTEVQIGWAEGLSCMILVNGRAIKMIEHESLDISKFNNFN